MIIDLSQYKEVEVHSDQQEVIIRGGVLMKELQIALSKENQFTSTGFRRAKLDAQVANEIEAVANGNTVGAIPYMVGGGISSYTPLIGYACENILSARIVVASGEVIVASSIQNQDLLWAIRGAGQFFGVVTELTVRTHDPGLMGPNGKRQIGMLFYPPKQASEVCTVLKRVVSANDHASAGHFMAMNDPSQGRVLMVAPQYFGTGPDFQATFKPFTDMKPLSHNHQASTFEKHSDHLSWVCPKGEFKRFSQTGLASINPDNFARLVDLHQELTETLPGTERSAFTIEWHTKSSSEGSRQTETAFGLKNIDVWL